MVETFFLMMDKFKSLALILLILSFANVCQSLTEEELEERARIVMNHCREGFVFTPESVVLARVPELALKNAVEPKCLQRCLKTYERINFLACEGAAECESCMAPCVERGTYGMNCTEYCEGIDVSKMAQGRHKTSTASSSLTAACVDSCEYYQTNYEEKSDMVCPTPQAVSKEDWMYRDDCIEKSDCYFDTQCKLKNQKCCPSRTDARFCVDMSSTGNHSSLSFVDPHSYIDHFFNFVVEVQQVDEALIIEYRLRNGTSSRLLPDFFTVALFAWRTSLNFKEEPDYRFHSFSSFLEGKFKYSMLAGFFYKFKIGIYNEYGLIGTKLDNLRNRTFGQKRMPVIKRVPRVRNDKIFCTKTDEWSSLDCDISLSWSAVPDNEYPLLYNVAIDSCGFNPFEPTSALNVTRKKLKICRSSFNVTIGALAKINLPDGGTEVVYSAPRTFSFNLIHNNECKDDGATDQEFPVAQAVVLRTMYTKTQRMRLHVNQSALFFLNSFRKKIDILHVNIQERFCLCRTKMCTHRAEFWLPIDKITDIEFEVEAKSYYTISMYLASSKNNNLCHLVSSQSKPPIRFTSRDNGVLQNSVSGFFPMETPLSFTFPGKMWLQFWNLDTVLIEHRMELRGDDFPLITLPFVTRCSSQLYVAVYYQPIDNATESEYGACADSGYPLYHVPSECYTEEEYYRFFVETTSSITFNYIAQQSLYFLFCTYSVNLFLQNQ